MKKILKNLFVFLLPILIINFVLIIKYGVKDLFNLFIVGDLNSQYMPLIDWVQDVLHSKESIFYSFSKGIGGNMFSTFTYYLSSPLNLILFFFNSSKVVFAIYLLINIKIGLGALTMYIFLKNKFKEKNYINLLIFSIIYALSGIVINFYSNIMWLDICYLTPLVILGLDNIIHRKKPYIYIIFLSLSIISNFYMSYMLCIFCVVYFVYEMVLTYKKDNKKEIKNIIINFIKYSLLSVLISSVILVPTIMDMKNIFRYGINKPILYFDLEAIPMMFSRLFVGSMNIDTMFSHNEVNIYISVISIVILVFYFLNKKINKKEKIATASVILLFILSIIFNLFNLIWHGFSFPNGYNYRFIYFYVFFIVLITYRSFNLLIKTKKVDLNILKYIIHILIILIILLINKYGFLSNNKITITIIFISVYLLYIYKKEYISNILLLIIVIIELAININYSFITRSDVVDYYKNNNINLLYDIEHYRKEICARIDKVDINYRMELEQIISANDSFICDYDGVNTALSTNNRAYYKFMANAGNIVTYSTLTDDFDNGPFIDSILGLRNVYKLINNAGTYYKFDKDIIIINHDGEVNEIYSKYENPYALKLGYLIDSDENIKFINNAFEYQNELAKKMSGIDLEIFEKVDLIDSSNTKDEYKKSYYLEPEDKNYYIYNYVPIPINQEEFGMLSLYHSINQNITSGHQGIIAFEDLLLNTTISIEYTATEKYKEYNDLQLYSFNKENFELIIEKLKENQFNVTKKEKNILEGNIKVNEDDSLLMITVPYEKGWNIYVDGKKIEYEEVYDTFIGIRLNKGYHEIKMVFYSPGIVIGSIMTLIGVGILFYKIYYERKKYNKNV